MSYVDEVYAYLFEVFDDLYTFLEVDERFRYAVVSEHLIYRESHAYNIVRTAFLADLLDDIFDNRADSQLTMVARYDETDELLHMRMPFSIFATIAITSGIVEDNASSFKGKFKIEASIDCAPG